jgi:prepilin-type N-terminal cleavage/methylation domain-containing protein
MRKKNLYCGYGFTIVEMLTTVAIIAILIGLLIPALNMVKEAALNVKQKAQFNAIEIALTAFNAERDDYPPSDEAGSAGDLYCGAQKLAEAIVGQDGFGVHPDTEWRSDGQMDTDGDGIVDTPLYYKPDGTGISTLLQAEIDANIQSRKGPFLDLEMANAVKLGDLYSSPPNDNFVLADMYELVRHGRTQKRTGMPILYYRADTTKVKHDPTDYIPVTDNIYNSFDSFNCIVQYAPPFNSLLSHPLSDNTSHNIFYERTWNKNFTAPPRPYNFDSFILHSAGLDGLYGTADDVFNFDE